MSVIELFFESVAEGSDFRHACRIREGEPEQVVGREAACDVCLPDPDKTISRRHLAVWNQAGDLWFRVLSSVNGVDLPGGEVPPGARAMLPLDQTLIVGAYRLYAAQVSERPVDTAGMDATVIEPMAFQHSVSPTVAVMSRSQALKLPAGSSPSPEHDPFADWAFQTDAMGLTAGLGTSPVPHSKEMSVFLKAVGLDPERIGNLSTEEIETLGRVVRVALEGLLSLEFKPATDNQAPSLLARPPGNPLHNDWTLENKLRYLLGGRAASVGFPKPEQALKGWIADIQIHHARVVVGPTVDADAVEHLKAGHTTSPD